MILQIILKSDFHLPKQLFVFICFNEGPLKMMKNASYFMIKVLFILEIFKFLFRHFGYVEKRLDKETTPCLKLVRITLET